MEKDKRKKINSSKSAKPNKSTTLLHEWLEGKEKLTREDVMYCLEHFTDNRKNYTLSGLLNLTKCNFQDTDLRDLPADKIDFTDANLNNTAFDRNGVLHLLELFKSSEKALENLNLSGLDLRNIEWYKNCIKGCLLKDSQLDRKFIMAAYDEIKSGDCSIEGADLSDAELGGKFIKDYGLGINSFEFLDLSGINFTECNFTNANLSGALLDNANFSKAHMNNAHIIASYCRNTDFSGATLQNANLMHSDFSDADFRNAILAEIRI